MKRYESYKRYGMVVVVLMLALLTLLPLNLNNSYLRAGEFDTVTVHTSDTVTALASRYTTDDDKLRELTQAIIEINGLNADGSNLRAGQSLRVPVLSRERNTQLAER